MSIKNLRNLHLSPEKAEEVKAEMASLESSLAEIQVNLTAEDRQKYGSINENNKLFVNRVADFHRNQPSLQTPQVNWEEFDKDFESRAFLTGIIDRMETVLQSLKNARILHDYDNYQDALVDYAYTSFMAGTSAQGYEVKQNELGQFFLKRAKKKANSNDNTAE